MMRAIAGASIALLLVTAASYAAADPPGKIDLLGGAEIFRIDTAHFYWSP